MSIQIRIPTPLQRLTNNQAEVSGQGGDVLSLFDNLEDQFPGIKERIFDETGSLRRFVNIYINDEDIRFLQGDKTELKDGDEVSIIPAIAGGAL